MSQAGAQQVDKLTQVEWMLFSTAVFRGLMGLAIYGTALLYLPKGYWTPIMGGTGFLFMAQAFAEMVVKYRRRRQVKKLTSAILLFLGVFAIFISLAVFFSKRQIQKVEQLKPQSTEEMQIQLLK